MLMRLTALSLSAESAIRKISGRINRYAIDNSAVVYIRDDKIDKSSRYHFSGNDNVILLKTVENDLLVWNKTKRSLYTASNFTGVVQSIKEN